LQEHWLAIMEQSLFFMQDSKFQLRHCKLSSHILLFINVRTLEEFPLASLRQLTMLISALVIPVIYTLMRVLGCAHTTALFTSGLFIFGKKETLFRSN
jgi:dolichyl-phosphate-mannose--protein O-mannosyl transferase